MAGLYTRCVSGILFPLHEKLKSHSTVAVRKAMEQSQWWPKQQLVEYQNERLRVFIDKVYQQVPYYRQLFDGLALTPAAIQETKDLQKLPFLTKSLIRNNEQQLRAKGATDLARFNTGGSSGEPLIFYIGKERVSHDVAAKWRATRWWGVDIGDPEIVVWGSPIELGSQDRVRLFRDRILRTELLSAFEMSEQKVTAFIDRIIGVRPAMLFGYPSAFCVIAEQAVKQGVALNTLGIKVVFVTSERLYDHQRELIERVFGCPVANGYGGRDAGFIAHQCPSGNMHITAEDIIVEVVDEQGRAVADGESGEIVVTHMATSHFPFIRYKTGDVGRLSDIPCECGRGLPLLAEIQGRTTDFIVAADGTLMHGLALIYVVRDLPQVSSFKIIQETRERLRLMLVTGEGYNEQVSEQIIAGFKQRLGAQVEIQIERVAEIPKEKSGKFRYVVSHVQA